MNVSVIQRRRVIVSESDSRLSVSSAWIQAPGLGACHAVISLVMREC